MKLSRLTLACLLVMAGPAIQAQTANAEHNTVRSEAHEAGQRMRDAGHRVGAAGRKAGHDVANAGRHVGHKAQHAQRQAERHMRGHRETHVTTRTEREQHAAASSADAGSEAARQRRMDEAYEGYRSQAPRQR